MDFDIAFRRAPKFFLQKFCASRLGSGLPFPRLSLMRRATLPEGMP
ncbi:MAG: hypothetical protein JNK34_04625 [Tabrizicola sp.]|nr:hypothetical protein [Tabrizicola sp.]